ncbi:hypothetical protein EsDP_00007345 [Epichloe bromicola]|uniref:RING-type E3 ubiquitin transferase n=1 Tax=Epichloe bromicola TaxID=79588 RepID=A0ABQ0D0A6_9HYPO
MKPSQDQNDDDIRKRVLQNTLEEVAARQEDATADCCVICLDIVTEPCEALPCGHRNFDYICVSNWLFERPQCPLCKARVVKVVHGPKDAPVTTFFDQKKAAATSSSTTAANSPPTRSFYTADYARRARLNCPRSGPRRFWEQGRRAAVSDVIANRRSVYRHQRYSKHVGSNRLSCYRELTSHMFCTDTELVSRARMWIRRELRVFSFLSPSDGDESNSQLEGSSASMTEAQRRRANNAEFLLEYVVAILKSVDIMGSGGQAEEMLSDFLGRDNTRLFLHELRAWLRSPFTKLEDWDRAVQYEDVSETRLLREEASRDESSAGQGFRVNQKGDFYRPRGGSCMNRKQYRSRGERASRRRSRSPA